jgi:hypothetical protein
MIKLEKVLIDGEFKKFYHVYVNKDNYRICIKAANNMWANKKRGSKYNEGIINTKEDPRKAERIGKIGEMAFGLMFNLPMDTSYIEYGDKMDFFYKGKTINMKCSVHYSNREVCLVKGMEADGRRIELPQDIYVFGYLKNEDFKNEFANVVIIGYQTKEFIENQNLVKSTKDNHYNYITRYKDLMDVNLI